MKARFLSLISLVALSLVTGILASPPAVAGGPPELVFRGKTPWGPFEHATVERPPGPIHAYVIRADEPSGPRPTLVVLQGSPCLPLFMMSGNRRASTLMFQEDLPAVASRLHLNVVAIERRGLQSFGPPPATKEEAREQARCTPEHGGVTKASRVDDAVAVIRALRRQPWSGEIHVIGHSEGADVAAGIARALRGRGIRTVALMSGAGVTRFFEYAALTRATEGSAGAARVIQEQIELTGPHPPAEYRGASRLRDLTYAVASTPLQDLRGLRLPVFVASGDRDDHSSVAGADAFVTEMLRDRRQPIQYLLLPDLDHGYVDSQGQDRSGAVLDAYLRWALGGRYGRGVSVGLGN